MAKESNEFELNCLLYGRFHLLIHNAHDDDNVDNDDDKWLSFNCLFAHKQSIQSLVVQFKLGANNSN